MNTASKSVAGTVAKHEVELYYLRRDLDGLRQIVIDGDKHLSARIDAMSIEMRTALTAINAKLETLSPESITVHVSKGRLRWNSVILAGVAASVALSILDKMGVDTEPMRDAIAISNAVGATPDQTPIDGEDLRGPLQ